jgi:RNA polymerase sigma-70 factor, ECF subfamily
MSCSSWSKSCRPSPTTATGAWRAQQRQKSARPPVVGAAPLAEVPAPEEDSAFGEVEYRQQLVGRALELMRGEFHPATWKACWEYAVQGRPVEDVARELGLSVNAVYLAKSRLLRRLRQELADLLE